MAERWQVLPISKLFSTDHLHISSVVLEDIHETSLNGDRDKIQKWGFESAAAEIDRDPIEYFSQIVTCQTVGQEGENLLGNGSVELGILEVQVPFRHIDIDFIADFGGEIFDLLGASHLI
jgi:hypothetical protein